MMKLLSFTAASMVAACSFTAFNAGSTPEPERATPASSVLFVMPAQQEAEYTYAWIIAPAGDERVAPTGLMHAYVDGRSIGEFTIAGHVESDDTLGCSEPPRVTLGGHLSYIGEAGAVLTSANLNSSHRLLPIAAQEVPLAELRKALASAPDVNVESLKRLTPQLMRGDGVQVMLGDDGSEIALLTSTTTDATGASLTSLLALLERQKGGVWQNRLLELKSGCSDCDGMPTQYVFRAAGDFDGDGVMEFLLQATGYEQWTYVLLNQEAGSWTLKPLGGGGGC